MGGSCYGATHKGSKPCHFVGVDCPVRQIAETKEPAIVEHIHYDRNGEPKNVEVHGYPIFDNAGNVVQIIEYCLDITERRRAEEELKKHRDHLEELVQDRTEELTRTIQQLQNEVAERIRAQEEIKSLAKFPGENPNPVLRITKDGEIIYANDGSLPFLKAWNCEVDQCLPDHWRKRVSDIFNSGHSEEMEVACEGQIFLVTFTPIVDSGYLYAYGRDITERKRAEEALRESEELYRTIFETTGTAAVIVEEDTTISLANAEFEKLSGYSREELEGKESWTRFPTRESLQKLTEYHRLRRIDPGAAPRSYEAQFVNRDGDIIDCLVTVSLIASTGQSVVFVIDITEPKEEAERIQAAKMEALRQLVAGVAHQMNSPIGAISSDNDVSSRAVGKIKEIMNEAYSQEMAEHKRLMEMLNILERTNQVSQTAADEIARIVANLRHFVRLDEAELQFADIHEGLDNVIALMAPEFSNRIDVVKNYGDVPRIYCSPSSLNQVFMSVLKNASEAITGKGEIRLRTSLQGDYVRIEISDTGKGIPAEDVDRIFDPGYTTKGVRVGVGLGLPICYKIVVNEHNGHIDVASKSGEGTTFTITLPTRRDRRK